MFWVRWAVGVVAMAGIPLVWMLDPGVNRRCDGPWDEYSCDTGGFSGSPVPILLTLLLLAAVMWAILATKEGSD